MGGQCQSILELLRPLALTCSSWNNNSARTRWQSRVTRSKAMAEASRAGSLSGGPTLASRSARDLWGSTGLRVQPSSI